MKRWFHILLASATIGLSCQLLTASPPDGAPGPADQSRAVRTQEQREALRERVAERAEAANAHSQEVRQQIRQMVDQARFATARRERSEEIREQFRQRFPDRDDRQGTEHRERVELHREKAAEHRENSSEQPPRHEERAGEQQESLRTAMFPHPLEAFRAALRHQLAIADHLRDEAVRDGNGEVWERADRMEREARERYWWQMRRLQESDSGLATAPPEWSAAPGTSDPAAAHSPPPEFQSGYGRWTAEQARVRNGQLESPQITQPLSGPGFGRATAEQAHELGGLRTGPRPQMPLVPGQTPETMPPITDPTVPVDPAAPDAGSPDLGVPSVNPAPQPLPAIPQPAPATSGP